MFRRSFIVCLFVLIAVSIAACSATPTRRAFKEGVKDSYVSSKVKVKLTADKLVDKRNFDVDTWRGVVTLTGRARSQQEKERAEQLAWQVKGVRGVDNFLRVIDDASAPTEAVAAATVKETVKEKVKTKEKVKGTEIADEVLTTKKEKVVVKNATVKNKVEGPVVFEETETVKTEDTYTAKRSAERYNKPATGNIKEEDLTDEDKLAKEAAEELRKLRGDEAY